MRTGLSLLTVTLFVGAAASPCVRGSDLAVYFHQDGPLAGTLESDSPLPIYDADPSHLWNRMFAAFYIRPRNLPAVDGRTAMVRYEGGDVIEFLAWGKTEYWSSEAVFRKVPLAPRSYYCS